MELGVAGFRDGGSVVLHPRSKELVLISIRLRRFPGLPRQTPQELRAGLARLRDHRRQRRGSGASGGPEKEVGVPGFHDAPLREHHNLEAETGRGCSRLGLGRCKRYLHSSLLLLYVRRRRWL